MIIDIFFFFLLPLFIFAARPLPPFSAGARIWGGGWGGAGGSYSAVIYRREKVGAAVDLNLKRKRRRKKKKKYIREGYFFSLKLTPFFFLLHYFIL